MKTPILLAKIKGSASDGNLRLVGGAGLVKWVRPEDEPALRSATGFSTLAELATALGRTDAELASLYRRYEADYFLVDLDQWNKLYWDAAERVYVNARGPGQQPVDAIAVPLAPPADPWFCTGEERAFLARKLEEHLGSKVGDDVLLLGNNGVRDGCFFWQIVAWGRVCLTIHFRDRAESAWEFVYASGIEKLPWGGCGSSQELEIARQIRANESARIALEQNTIAFIQEVTSEAPNEKPLIYFSGGKESLVMLDLFRKANVSAQLLFAGTGMDFPEDEQFIVELRDWLKATPGLDAMFPLHIEPGDAARAQTLFEKHGMLGLGNMWCRAELKYPIRSAAVKRLYPKGVAIAFEGSRWYETDFRRSHPRINVITDIDGYEGSRQVWAHPLADWNGFDIWTYIHNEKLPINPLYAKGYQRTTCWSCPLVNPFHRRQSERQHPEKWSEVSLRVISGFEGSKAPPQFTPF
jgi:phosphoadenosine phosphosulfate reductase